MKLFTAILCYFMFTTAPVQAQSEIDDWSRASPTEAGFDGAAIDALIADLKADRQLRGLHSLLIVRGGKLVVEEYFDGWTGDRLHTLQSVSKSFTSAIVGIAIARGDFEGVDENILAFFPKYDIKNLDDRKRGIRLEDLLTMRSGTDYDEGFRGSPHSRLNGLARDWDRFYLDRPMEADPGTRFQYDSGAVILTSSLFQRRTGMHADAYMAEHLFKPLGINAYRWDKNAEDHPHTGGGLYLTPRDMAKFGQLYLQKGKWGEQQIVSENWIDASTSQHVDFDRRRWFGHGTGYAYWWWIMEPDPAGAGTEAIYAALGHNGQHIFVVPEHDLVVVTTAGIGGSMMHKPIDVLYTHILPAIMREDGGLK